MDGVCNKIKFKNRKFEITAITMDGCGTVVFFCKHYHFNEQHDLVAGGANRFQSVKNGLKKIDDKSIVMIHDGVRPIVSQSLLKILIKSQILSNF